MLKFIGVIKESTTLTTWLSLLSKTISFFLILPLLLINFEAKDINIWYLFISIITWQWILEGPFSNNFVRNISYNKENENIIKNSIIIQNMKSTYKRLAFFTSLSLLLFGFFFMERHIKGSSNPTLGVITYLIYVFIFPVIIYGSNYANTLQGYHLVANIKITETICNLLAVCINFFLILFFKNIYVLIINVLLWQLVLVIYNRKLVKSKVTLSLELKEVDSKWERKNNRDILKSLVGVFFSQGVIQSSLIVYSYKLSPEILATYLFCFNLIQNVRSFSMAPFYSKLPQLATLAKTKRLDELTRLGKIYMTRAYLTYFLLFFIIFFLLKNKTITPDTKIALPSLELWILFGLAFIIERFGAMHLQLYSNSGKIIWHKANGLSGIVIIILWYFMFDTFQEKSFPLALLIGYTFIYSIMCAIPSYKYLKTTFWEFELKVFVPIISIFIVLCILLYEVDIYF